MTSDEFLDRYIERSKISRETLQKACVVLRCECTANNCEGWALVTNSAQSIVAHNRLFGPKTPVEDVK